MLLTKLHSIMGLKKDLHLVGNQYSTLGSLFYIGELVWEVRQSSLCTRSEMQNG